MKHVRMMLLGASVLLLGTGCLKDLRPTAVQSAAKGARVDAEEEGVKLLRQSFEATGCRTLTTHKTARVRLTDTWNGVFAFASPWPAAAVDVEMEFGLGKRDVSATFIAPEGEPNWVVVDDEPTLVFADGSQKSGEEGHRFIVRALQYFFEYCARAQEHGYISYAGQESFTSDGIDHDYAVVYGTWGDGEARADIDQYLIYIDQDTHRIEKLQYTVRDSSAALVGTMHYSDFRLVHGAMLPFRMAVTFDIHDDTDSTLHEVLVQSIAFDDGPPLTGKP